MRLSHSLRPSQRQSSTSRARPTAARSSFHTAAPVPAPAAAAGRHAPLSRIHSCSSVSAMAHQSELPAVLAAALSIDNEQRKQAEARIATLSKDPALVPALVEQLRLAPDERVRQLAAILLRRRTLPLWLKLPEPTREALKVALVDAIVREPRCVLLQRSARMP